MKSLDTFICKQLHETCKSLDGYISSGIGRRGTTKTLIVEFQTLKQSITATIPTTFANHPVTTVHKTLN